jgi:DNA repair exonuclease SbcCD nuclease subunit
MDDITFQYISDIHLELCCNTSEYIEQLQSHARFLILAGDIGNPYHTSYASFLKRASELFESVFLVSGNHEYYNGSSMIDTECQIRSVISEIPSKNIVYLQNEVYHIPGSTLHVFGGTFWSRIPTSNMKLIQSLINDYKMIRYITPTEINELHTHAVSMLEKHVKDGRETDMQWIVVSHHIPKMCLIDEKYKNSSLNSAFASDIDIADDPSIITWVYGHTHTPNQSGKFLCNPIGYPEENEHVNMNQSFSISYSEEEAPPPV